MRKAKIVPIQDLMGGAATKPELRDTRETEMRVFTAAELWAARVEHREPVPKQIIKRSGQS
jgi:hypothetical protein